MDNVDNAPIITVNTGTPKNENPSESFNIQVDDNLVLSGQSANSSPKSSLQSDGSTRLKFFEKFNESVKAISRISSRILHKDDMEEKSSVEGDIDVMCFSPEHKYIATWSKEDGVLAVWTFQWNSDKIYHFFAVKTPFNKTNVEDTSKIFLSVEENGSHVAITNMAIIGIDESAVEPNIDLGDTIFSENVPEVSFLIYSTTLSQNDSARLNFLKIMGPLIFVRHSRLVCFTKKHMHVVSAKTWNILYSVNISQLVNLIPGYTHDSNEFLANAYEIFVDSLRSGYLICEETSGFSVWDLEGVLKQWFYTESIPLENKNNNLYAISQQVNLIARYHTDNITKGILSIYHIPTALVICNIKVSIHTFHISFLQKKEQIIVYAKNGNGIVYQLWDCWSGLMVFEVHCPHLNHIRPCLIFDDLFIQTDGNELTIHRIFSDYSSTSTKALQKNNVFFLSDSVLKLCTEIEYLMDRSICWCYIRDDNDFAYCKFKFEPWNDWTSPEVFAEWLDSEKKRFIIAGKHSIQVYKTKQRNQFINIELQYIWTVPITRCADIQFVSLEDVKNSESDDDEGTISKFIRVQLTNHYTAMLPLPGIDEKITYKTVNDACIALNFIRLQFNDDINCLYRLAIRDQLRMLIYSSVTQYPSAFNKIVLDDDNYIYPLKDFILLSYDNLVKKILEADQYIPLYHNDEQNESALSLLLELQKSELVERLVAYIFRHLRQNNKEVRPKKLGYSWTICKVLLDLFKYYPDKGEYIMKECSYFTTSLETPIRFLKTNLGDPLKEEERTDRNELATIVRDSKLPRENIFEIQTKRSILKLLGSYFRSRIFGFLNEQKTKYEYKQRYLERAQKTHPARLCVVPWPDFCVYPLPSREYKNRNFRERFARFWSIYISPSDKSPFADIALNGPAEMFGQVAMTAIIKFKWNRFGRKIYILSFAVYLIYSIIFCAAVSLNDDLVPPPEKSGWQIPAFLTCTIIPLLILFQEFRQMLGQTNYWSSVFNYAELAGSILPLTTSLMVIGTRTEPPIWLKSYSVLMLWFNLVLKLRGFSGPGEFIATTIEIFDKIKILLGTLLVVVLAFANSLFVLLRNVPQQELVPTFQGVLNSASGDVIGNISMSQIPQDGTNMWIRFDESIFASYSFLGIGWSSVLGFDQSLPLIIMEMLFSFIAVIMLLNLLIGFMTESFKDALIEARRAHLRQRAGILAEMELFLFQPSTRSNSEWFPHLIYYEAHADSVVKWRCKLDKEEIGEVDALFVKEEIESLRTELKTELNNLKNIIIKNRLETHGNDE